MVAAESEQRGVERVHAHNALSNNRLIASDFDGFGSGCASIQASSFASSSGGMRRPRIGWRPVAGRPRGLLGLSAIDLTREERAATGVNPVARRTGSLG